MNWVRQRWVLLPLLLLMLLAACGQQRPQTIDYHVGTDGLVLSFEHNTPPEEVYEESAMPIIVRLSNEGAYDVPLRDVMINLTVDPFYLSAQSLITEDEWPNESKQVYGKQPGYPDGDFVEYTSIIDVKKITGLREQPSTEVFASLCYPYGTTLGTAVCVDTNAFNQNQQRQVCNAETLTFPDQGAPVAITEVENRPTPVRVSAEGGRGFIDIVQPTFVFHVKNVGDGTVLLPLEPEADPSPDDYEWGLAPGLGPVPFIFFPVEKKRACRGFVQPEERNRVSIKAWLSGVKLECNPETILLRGGEGYTTCSYPTENISALGQANYVGVLKVDLGYLYQSSTGADVSILRRSPLVHETDYTVPERDEHPGFVNGVTRCEYCNGENRNSAECEGWDERANESATFACACSRDECLSMVGKGNCVYGATWCPGSNFCCNTA